MLRFACPSCGMTASAPEECAGRVSKCRGCHQPITVPPLPPKPAPPTAASLPQQPVKLAAARDRTALGRVISHQPTSVKPPVPSEATAASRNYPSLKPRKSSRSTGSAPREAAKPPQRSSLAKRSVLLGGIFLVFALGGLSGFGIYFYLNARKNVAPPSPEVSLARAPSQPEADIPQQPRDPAPPREQPPESPSPLSVDARPQPHRQEERPAEADHPPPPPLAPPGLQPPEVESASRPTPPTRVPPPRAEESPPSKPAPPPMVRLRPGSSINAAPLPASEPPVRPEPPPPPRTEPSPSRREEPPLDERLAPLVKALKSKKAQERLRALIELGNLRERGRPLAGAVCAVLVADPIGAIRQASLEALEKIHPELHAPVVVFMVEADGQKHIKAARDVAALGEQGRPAIVVLLSHLQSAPTRFSIKAPELINTDAQALAQIAPNEPVVQKTLIDLTYFTFVPPRHKTDIGGPTREAAVRVLGELMEKHPDQAERIAPGLIAAARGMTDETVRAQTGALLGKLAENHVKLRPQIAAGLLALASAGDTTVIPQLGKCGRDARDALPLLRKLKLHPTEAVRTAATRTIEQIEEALASAAPSPRAEEPPTRNEARPRTEDSSLPRELRPLVEQLKSGTTEERIKAARQLGELGEKAQPAARALCEAALSPLKKVSRAALQALEPVDAELHKSVFVLIVDEKAANHLDALRKLALLGEQGKPATPIVLYEIKRCQDLLNDPAARWGQNTLLAVTAASMRTLPKIAAEDPKALKAIIDLSKLSGEFLTLTKRRISTKTPFREEGLALLGGLAEEQPAFRKQIIPPVVGILKEGVQRTSSSNEYEVLAGIAEVEDAGHTLLKCGEEARPLVAKEVMPRLKELQFHKSDKVRKTAEELRKKIEDLP